MIHLNQPISRHRETPGKLRHITTLLLLTATMSLQADVLELRDGTVLGNYGDGYLISSELNFGFM